MKLKPTNFETPDDKMAFGDFLIRYEHKFLRNIYTIGLLALLNNFNKTDFINLATEQFVENKFAGDEIN